MIKVNYFKESLPNCKVLDANAECLILGQKVWLPLNDGDKIHRLVLANHKESTREGVTFLLRIWPNSSTWVE